MTNDHSLLRRFLFGSDPSRAWREEKVLRYIIHRLDEEVHLHDLLQDSYVRRNCTQEDVDGIIRNPELVHACRKRLEQVFGSGALDPRTHRKP